MTGKHGGSRREDHTAPSRQGGRDGDVHALPPAMGVGCWRQRVHARLVPIAEYRREQIRRFAFRQPTHVAIPNLRSNTVCLYMAGCCRHGASG